MSRLPTPASSLPRTPKLDDVEADQARFQCLHELTTPLARQALLLQLRELTADSGAALLLDPVQQLHALLSSEQAPGADGLLPVLDAQTLARLQASLAEHLASSGTCPEDGDEALAEDLAAEFSQSLWSSLLDHALQAKQKGAFGLGSLLPEWPRAGRASGLLGTLAQDLSHFGLPERALLEIAHGVARRLPGCSLACQGVIELPLGLSVPVAELQRFLEAQARKGRQHQADAEAAGRRRPADELGHATPPAPAQPSIPLRLRVRARAAPAKPRKLAR